MNDDYIFNAVGKISDELISEADEDKVRAYYILKRKNKKSKFLKIGTMAAGIVIIIGIVIPLIRYNFTIPGNNASDGNGNGGKPGASESLKGVESYPCSTDSSAGEHIESSGEPGATDAPGEKENTIKIGNLSLTVASLSFDDINNRDAARISVSSSETAGDPVSKLYIASDAYKIIGVSMSGKELKAVTVNNVTCYEIDIPEGVLSFDIMFEGHAFTDNNGALKRQVNFRVYADCVSKDTLSFIALSPKVNN